MTSSRKGSLSNTSDGGYALPRDQTESTRLNAQHYALTQRQGFLLHPRIQEALSTLDKPQILDVACGTGVWTLEVAEKFPNTSVTGLDVSADQFPPEWTWPSNSKLSTLDLLEDVPPEYQHKFDVLHCRLLLSAGPNVNSKVFMDTFDKLLKPGGWLQWEEVTYPAMSLVEPVLKDGQPTDEYNLTPIRWDTLADAVNMPYKTGWFGSFKKWIKQNSNFTDVGQLDLPAHPRTLKIQNDVAIGAMLSFADMLLQSSETDDAVKEKVREELEQFERYREEDRLVTTNLIVGTARSPKRAE